MFATVRDVPLEFEATWIVEASESLCSASVATAPALPPRTAAAASGRRGLGRCMTDTVDRHA
jgi:hypothetical protein